MASIISSFQKDLEPIYDNLFVVDFMSNDISTADLEFLSANVIRVNFIQTKKEKYNVILHFNLNLYENYKLLFKDVYDNIENKKLGISIKLHTKDGTVFAEVFFDNCELETLGFLDSISHALDYASTDILYAKLHFSSRNAIITTL
jgi:hypothetical protein